MAGRRLVSCPLCTCCGPCNPGWRPPCTRRASSGRRGPGRAASSTSPTGTERRPGWTSFTPRSHGRCTSCQGRSVRVGISCHVGSVRVDTSCHIRSVRVGTPCKTSQSGSVHPVRPVSPVRYILSHQVSPGRHVLSNQVSPGRYIL